MFMSNKALLDQLMGADRNESTFKGLREQWKDDCMCKPYLMDFCPYELFYNTKMFLGNCSKTHSDIVRTQFEGSSDDAEKLSLVRKYEYELLTHLEKLVDTVERKVLRQKDRINAAIPQHRVSETKEAEIAELNQQVSVSIKEVERLAESGQFEESTILMGKVSELQNRIKELSEDKFAKYVKKEIVCEVCGVLIGADVDAEGRPERAHDHVRGKQHMGMERVRLKIIELKSKHKIRKSRRDTDFVPSVELTKEMEREGLEVPVAVEEEDGGVESGEISDVREHRHERNRPRSRSRDREDEKKRKSKSRSRSISPISFSEDEFGRKRRRPRDRPRRDNHRERTNPSRWSRRNSPRRNRSRSRSKSLESVRSQKSMASITLE